MDNNIKAVLFDMDGVLIDAKEWHYEALNQALALFGIEISRYDHLVTYDGLPTKKKLELLSLDSGLPRELHAFINDIKQEMTLKIGYLKCRPTFAHQYALSRLKQRGYKLVSCSNSVRQTMTMLFERSALINYFDFYISNQDVEKPKPDPEMYRLAMNRLGVAPSECLILEDNEKGIMAAQASGGNLMIIKNVHDVTLENIERRIVEIERKNI